MKNDKDLTSNILIAVGAVLSALTHSNFAEVIGGWMAVGLLSWALSALVGKVFKMSPENKKLAFAVLVVGISAFSLFGVVVSK